jgi:hypothetical protein
MLLLVNQYYDDFMETYLFGCIGFFADVWVVFLRKLKIVGLNYSE